MALDIKNLEENDPVENQGTVLMQWEFFEYEEYQRTKLWYIIAILVSILFLVYAITVSNFLFAVIIVIVNLIILIQANRKPGRLDFKITKTGIVIGKSFHSYKDINKFWIIYNPPESKTLYLDFKSAIKPEVAIPLENKNPLKIRDILLKYLEEDLSKEEDSASEKIRRLLKL